MDRFEVISVIDFSALAHIYIPVWIDLKEIAKKADKATTHLHSSMDRFEVEGTTASGKTTIFTFQYG